MTPLRSTLAIVLSTIFFPTLALAAPPAEEATEAAGAAGAPAPAEPVSAFDPSGWAESFQAMLSDNAMVVGQRVLLAILLFIGGWLVAKVIAYGVYRILCSTQIDNKIAKKLRLGLLLEGDGKAKKEGAEEQVDHLERFLASIVYYMLMLLVIVGVLQYAGLSQAAGPIEGLVHTVVQALPLVGKALAILTVAYFAGTLLSKLVSRGLGLLRVDSRFAELSATPREGEETRRPFSEHVGTVIFWLVMVLGLSGAFEALRISAIAQPLQSAIDRVIGVIPSLAFAVLIGFAGYVLGRVVRAIVANLLDAVGLNRLVERVGMSRLFGAAKASWVVGTTAMAFIFIQAAIAAFNEIGLVTLSQPLTAMMERFWLILPSVAVSVVVVAVAVFAGKILRGVVAASLRNLGFDALLARLGFAKIAEREDRLGEPSELVGFLVQGGIILLAAAQALDNLHLATWAAYVNAFLAYLLKHVIVAMAIVVVGLGIGGYVRDVIEARQGPSAGEGGRRWLPEFARYVVLVFAFTMAVRQLEVAEDFVLLTFGLLFGSLCLAVAIAFGVGARGVAGEIVRKRYEEMNAAEKEKASSPSSTAPRRPSSRTTSTAIFGRPLDPDER